MTVTDSDTAVTATADTATADTVTENTVMATVKQKNTVGMKDNDEKEDGQNSE